MKKTTTTKRKKKVPVLDLHHSFSLTDVNMETRRQYAHYLREMVLSAGWKLMSQILEGNLSVLEKTIVLKVNTETGERLEEKDLDELRVQHAQITQLLLKPHELIKQFAGKEAAPVVSDYDPYSHGFKADTTREGAGSLSDST